MSHFWLSQKRPFGELVSVNMVTANMFWGDVKHSAIKFLCQKLAKKILIDKVKAYIKNPQSYTVVSPLMKLSPPSLSNSVAYRQGLYSHRTRKMTKREARNLEGGRGSISHWPIILFHQSCTDRLGRFKTSRAGEYERHKPENTCVNICGYSHPWTKEL